MTANAGGNFNISDFYTRGKFKSLAKAELWLIFTGGEGKSYILP